MNAQVSKILKYRGRLKYHTDVTKQPTSYPIMYYSENNGSISLYGKFIANLNH